MFKPCSRERERAPSALFLNCPGLDIAHRRLVQSVRRYGRSPAHVQAFWGGIYVIRHSIHSVEDTNLQVLYAYLVTHDAKA